MRARPSLGCRMPQSMRMTVDLPEPLGPRNPKIEPFSTEKLTWSTAVKWPKRFVRFSHSIMAALGLGLRVGLEWFAVKNFRTRLLVDPHDSLSVTRNSQNPFVIEQFGFDRELTRDSFTFDR